MTVRAANGCSSVGSGFRSFQDSHLVKPVEGLADSDGGGLLALLPDLAHDLVDAPEHSGAKGLEAGKARVDLAVLGAHLVLPLENHGLIPMLP
ncbi:hypothetical protein ABT168_38625 [Streptomyces sp. NPDC001793]|uniref:hypothetical protein n=1 Tax=Streptomyces sp. NPDC001793 TaxID=3154657 RepID=UPI00332536FB